MKYWSDFYTVKFWKLLSAAKFLLKAFFWKVLTTTLRFFSASSPLKLSINWHSRDANETFQEKQIFSETWQGFFFTTNPFFLPFWDFIKKFSRGNKKSGFADPEFSQMKFSEIVLLMRIFSIRFICRIALKRLSPSRAVFCAQSIMPSTEKNRCLEE